MEMTQTQPKSGLGTAGFILGLIAICTFWLLGLIALIIGVLGVIFGAVAYWGKWKDAKLGLAGFVLGLIAIILVIILYVLVIVWAMSLMGI
jgi:hypothetical protein